MYLMGVLDDVDVDWLAANGTGRHLAPGEVLVREKVPVDSLFVVLDGTLAVTVGATSVATLLSGEVVGEISFVDSRPPLATVKATGPARVLVIPGEKLKLKLASDRKFGANFYRALAVYLADRLRTTTGRLGYGAPGQDEDLDDSDDLGDDLLETLSQGTRRFDHLLRRVGG